MNQAEVLDAVEQEPSAQERPGDREPDRRREREGVDRRRENEQAQQSVVGVVADDRLGHVGQ